MSAPNFTATCQCGADKAKGALFCDPCYQSLPADMQGEINARVSDYKRTAERAALILIDQCFPEEAA